MARKTNYRFDRLERERKKAAKKAVKLEAKRGAKGIDGSVLNGQPQAKILSPKVRKCKMCSNSFQSSHANEQLCPKCKSLTVSQENVRYVPPQG